MPQTAAPQQGKMPLAPAIAAGAVRLFLSIVPILGGTALLFASSAAVPIVLGVSAIVSGVYGTVNVLKQWLKPRPPRQPKSPLGIKLKKWLNDPGKRRAFKINTSLAAIIGGVRCGTGIALAASLGALSGVPFFGLIAATAAGLTVVGAATAVGSLVTLGVFSIFTTPKRLEKINTKTASPPSSKLKDAEVKTAFNASANDNLAPSKPATTKPNNPTP